MHTRAIQGIAISQISMEVAIAFAHVDGGKPNRRDARGLANVFVARQKCIKLMRIGFVILPDTGAGLR